MIEQVKNVTFTFANSECIGRCLGCNSFNQLVICIIIWTSWKFINPVSVPRNLFLAFVLLTCLEAEIWIVWVVLLSWLQSRLPMNLRDSNIPAFGFLLKFHYDTVLYSSSFFAVSESYYFLLGHLFLRLQLFSIGPMPSPSRFDSDNFPLLDGCRTLF